MAQTPANEGRNNNGDSHSLAEKLKQESERLRELAEQLQTREKAVEEMEANYPFFKAAVYAWMREKVMSDPVPYPEKDLDAWAKEQGGLPLEDFINDL